MAALSGLIPDQVVFLAQTWDELQPALGMQQFFIMQQCLPSIFWGRGWPDSAAFALSESLSSYGEEGREFANDGRSY
ncbi:hypothetical protein Y032_0061g3223 [Ancylostoma ceylanicum]|uniref:Uncharacterized protein n=1 Tax=Ancylostoma ceylanicum TaxID=53326 RepID=A0A016U2Y1_9BILA|nr:hypothetical protein Y032_0061g3223 [Ancylostoma ceylanicum]